MDSLLKQMGFAASSFGFIAMTGCSTLYHRRAWDRSADGWLLSLDHFGISFMIMGSYAPLMLQANCMRILVFVWAVGIGGLLMEALRHTKPCGTADAETKGKESQALWSVIDIIHLVRYVVMGWAIVAAWSDMAIFPQHTLNLAIGGGLCFTLGIPFFVSGCLEFHLAVWHAFVLAGSICFFLLDYQDIVGVAPA
ncbi:unnamed protein product [Polarella glacialis]|uniref:Uncharacterized protein n=1 Tax=Polarella glacialis TaxID=89957 RepID=A0A813DLR4_POLGL|nr:unnamed protein product [Polarella glacialis]